VAGQSWLALGVGIFGVNAFDHVASTSGRGSPFSIGRADGPCGTLGLVEVVVFWYGRLTNGYAELSGTCKMAISGSNCDAQGRRGIFSIIGTGSEGVRKSAIG